MMKHSELVERVARGIVRSKGRDEDECIFGSGDTENGFTCYQRAWELEKLTAICVIAEIHEAVREPSEKMRLSGIDVEPVHAIDWVDTLFGTGVDSYETIMAASYRAMLAASPLTPEVET